MPRVWSKTLILETLFHEQIDYNEHFKIELAGEIRDVVKHHRHDKYYFLTPKLTFLKKTNWEITHIDGVLM